MNIVSFLWKMEGLVFPSWVLSNTLRYYHHFPVSRSSPDTPQRAALSCASAFAMLPWKHFRGIAHYRNSHLHITSETLSGKISTPAERRKKTHCKCLFAQTLNLNLTLSVQEYVAHFVRASFCSAQHRLLIILTERHRVAGEGIFFLFWEGGRPNAAGHNSKEKSPRHPEMLKTITPRPAFNIEWDCTT